MALDEEAQEHLGSIVQTCMRCIDDGMRSSSQGRPSVNSYNEGGSDNLRGSVVSDDRRGSVISDESYSRSGRIGLRESYVDEDFNVEASQINLDERRSRDLQRQAMLAERESQQMRERN